MQIVGEKCKICKQNIVFLDEGKFCAQCETFVHVACLPQANCDVCGQPFQYGERPKPDPKSDAFVPRALHPAKSGGPVLAIFLVLAFALVAISLSYVLRAAAEHGH